MSEHATWRNVTFICNSAIGDGGARIPLPDFITDEEGRITHLDPGEADLLRQTMDWADGRDR